MNSPTVLELLWLSGAVLLVLGLRLLPLVRGFIVSSLACSILGYVLSAWPTLPPYLHIGAWAHQLGGVAYGIALGIALCGLVTAYTTWRQGTAPRRPLRSLSRR